MSSVSPFNSDRPLADEAHDRLGFSLLADELVRAISASYSRDSIVIGLEAPWGSGKSTLLNFLRSRLALDSRRPIVFDFSPWLVDDRRSLLGEFITEFIRALSPAEKRVAHRWDVAEFRNRRELAASFRRFARLAEKVKKLGEPSRSTLAAAAADLPLIRGGIAIARFLLSAVVAVKPSDATLASTRAELVSRIALLDRYFVVLIDEIDRLEPEEAREMFRLLKAVADFPNTVYIVAYDRAATYGASQFSDDITRQYIDKIVQVPARIPAADPIDLRSVLLEIVVGTSPANGLLGRDFRTGDAGGLPGRSESDRFGRATMHLARTYLTTPRRIVLIGNLIRLYWPRLKDDADLADYIIHVSISNFDPDLARWIDEYMSLLLARRSRSTRLPELIALREQLDTLLQREPSRRDDVLALLRLLLPRLRVS